MNLTPSLRDSTQAVGRQQRQKRIDRISLTWDLLDDQYEEIIKMMQELGSYKLPSGGPQILDPQDRRENGRMVVRWDH